jgi:hypothetical protein
MSGQKIGWRPYMAPSANTVSTLLTSLYGAVLIGSFMSAAVALHLSLMGGNKTGIPLIVGLLGFIGYLLR